MSNNITRTFTAAELKEWEMPYEAPPGGTIINDTHAGSTRWATVHKLIFTLPKQPAGTAWQIRYCKAATEYQDQDPWNSSKEVVAELVHEVERTVKVWEPVMGPSREG